LNEIDVLLAKSTLIPEKIMIEGFLIKNLRAKAIF